MSEVIKTDLPVEAICAYCVRQPIERLSVFALCRTKAELRPDT